MSFYWSFGVTSYSIQGRLACWPVKPGSVIITALDGINDKTLVDDGAGLLTGDGAGRVDYDYGHVSFDFSGTLPTSGTPVKADYTPVEGGCADDCGACKTHYIRLDITPASISGSSEYTIADAWSRLFEKIRRDILPIHVEIKSILISESFTMSIGYRFDLNAADAYPVDSVGLRPLLDDTSW